MFEFGGGVRLEVVGARADLAHFAAEYGPAATGHGGEPHARVAFGKLPRDGDGTTVDGSHKTVSWRVRLGDPAESPVEARIDLRGRPRWFCRSLVQGYFVEPLTALAAANEGRVLLPGAGFARDGGAVVLIGHSGAGKSTLMARLAALGVAVLGDDHVVLDGDGRCWPFPRRVRLYPDIRETAPGAWQGMSARRRYALAARGVVRRLSGGTVAPPLAVDAGEVATGGPAAALPVTEVLVLERDGGGPRVERAPLPSEDALAAARAVLDAQRANLSAAGGPWPEALERAAALETETLSAIVANARTERLRVPDSVPAPQAIAALHDSLAPG